MFKRTMPSVIRLPREMGRVSFLRRRQNDCQQRLRMLGANSNSLPVTYYLTIVLKRLLDRETIKTSALEREVIPARTTGGKRPERRRNWRFFISAGREIAKYCRSR